MLNAMKLIHVYPILRNTRLATLSYYTTLPVTTGAIVHVPIRGKQVPALIVHVENIRDAKSLLRSASYAIKKVSARNYKTPITQAFVRALQTTATQYCTSVGSALFGLLPMGLITELPDVPPHTGAISAERATPEKLVLQMPDTERMDEYRNIVRACFAKKQSVLVVVPTRIDGEKIKSALSRGIADYIVILHGALSKKVLLQEWKKALNNDHPVLIITTSAFVAIPRHDLHTIIIDSEGSNHYTFTHSPRIDMRFLIERYAEEMNARLILADLPLRIETMHRRAQGILDELAPVHKRLIDTAKAYLVDMRLEQKKEGRTSSYIISDFLKEKIDTAERTLIISARRGLAPITICGDCKNTVRCDVCEASVVVHKGKKENLFVCHACGAVRSTAERCRHCSSWRLQTFGVSTGLVAETVTELFPEHTVIEFTADTISTFKEALAACELFYSNKKTILVATDMVLPYLRETIPLTAIASIDSLLSIPQWNIYERIFRLLIKLRQLSHDAFVLQSRHPEQDLLQHAMRGHIGDFCKDELAVRSKFGYPPFSTLIKVSVSGTAIEVEQHMKELETLLVPYGFSGTTHLIKKAAASYEMHGFIKCDTDTWPRHELSEILSHLPHKVTVTVDPDSVL